MTDTPDGAIKKGWPWDKMLHRAIAARDGGWFCAYCQVRLVSSLDDLVKSSYPPDYIEAYTVKDGLGWPEADHVHPKSKGGSDDIENRVLACSTCNQRKGSRTIAEWQAAA